MSERIEKQMGLIHTLDWIQRKRSAEKTGKVAAEYNVKNVWMSDPTVFKVSLILF